MLASILASVCLIWADALVREGWPFIPVREHWLCALLLYAGAGALFGSVAAFVLLLERRWAAGRLSLFVRAGFFAAFGGIASVNVGLWAFSGEAVSATALAHFGPALLALGAALAVGASALLALWAAEQAAGGALRAPLSVALGFLVLGWQLARLDLTFYVALYTRLHTALELCAWAALSVGFGLLLALLGSRWPRWAPAAWLPAGLGLAALAALALSAPLRTHVEGGLRHVFLEEGYVGRMLRRLQLAEAFIADPRGFRSLSWSRLARLRQRYGFGDAALDPVWQAEPPARAAEQQALWKLRDPLRRYNVIVYYVDTLRSDVAADAATMPNVVEFAEGAVRYRRAYAAGSDTLRSLPALTGGDYDVLSTPANDVLRVARRAGYESTLLIPKSAQYFLSKLRPEFRFDRTVTVADHPAVQEVWGYGADQPTSASLVDRALDYLDEPRKPGGRPFFLWLFNFDLHNWRELSNAHVEQAMQRFEIKDEEGKLPFRYRAVAAAIDAEFGRFAHELSRRRLLEDTIVLFLSDHGEALGRDGFWVHSVFLWEHLVRVPLILKAPGLAPRQIDERVSLVDVAPTLARYMQPNPDLSGYAGEDLLLRLLSPGVTRRLPILLVAASKDVLVRVGVVDPRRDYKLVLSLEAALPELYDLRAPDPDASNVAEQQPELTRQLLRGLVASPVFPRSLWDFEVRDTKEQRAPLGVPVER